VAAPHSTPIFAYKPSPGVPTTSLLHLLQISTTEATSSPRPSPSPLSPNLSYQSHLFPTPFPITSLSLSLFVGRISDPQCISLPTEVHHHPVLEYIPRTTRSPPRHCRSMASMPPLLEGLPMCHPESSHCPVPEKRPHSRRRRCCPDAHY
jgi:hypothetical protein